MEKKKRGKIKSVLFLFIIVLLLASAIFLLIKEKTQTRDAVEESSPPFKIDQILLKVLIKEDESMTKPINIMDISPYDLYIEINTQNLYDIISISDNKFALKTGQTKTVYINFSSFVNERGIKQEPGIYIDNLLIKGNSNIVKVPTIVEIEAKEILFDANVEVPIEQKQIEQGNYLNLHITLFNLKKIGLTNLNMEYFIKDVFGDTIITETESITVETQTSFVKTIHIPENLNLGEYVVGAVARYGSSVGTSTLLFEVTESIAKEEGLLNYYKNNRLFFWILLVTLIIIISAIVSYMSLLIHGKTIHSKEKPSKIKVEEREEKKLVKKEIKHKEPKHKKLFLVLLCLLITLLVILILILFNYRIPSTKQFSTLFSNIAVKISEFGKIVADKSSDLWNNTKPLLSNAYKNSLNWLKNIVERTVYYIKNIWETVLYLTPKQKKYLYYILGIIIGLQLIIYFIIIAKKHLFEKVKEKVNIGVFGEIFEKFKELPRKEKVIILIFLVTLFLIAIVSFLIDLGILSA